MRTAQARKLASQAANPASRVENEFLRLGLKRTLMDRRVPKRPKSETEVSAIPSTKYS